MQLLYAGDFATLKLYELQVLCFIRNLGDTSAPS